MPNSRNKWKSESNTAVERRRDQWMVWSPSGQETNSETGTNETQQSFTRQMPEWEGPKPVSRPVKSEMVQGQVYQSYRDSMNVVYAGNTILRQMGVSVPSYTPHKEANTSYVYNAYENQRSNPQPLPWNPSYWLQEEVHRNLYQDQLGSGSPNSPIPQGPIRYRDYVKQVVEESRNRGPEPFRDGHMPSRRSSDDDFLGVGGRRKFNLYIWANTVEATAYTSHIASTLRKTTVQYGGRAIGSTISNVATQLNRYTPDIYDVGHHGQADLTSDAGMFILGNTAMVAQNAVRMARKPAKYGVKLADIALHNSYRMEKIKQKSEYVRKMNPKVDMKTTQILTGYNRKDVVHYRDRIAWNRFKPNQAKDMAIKERSTLLFRKWQANRYNRVLGKSNNMKNAFKNMKTKQFSLFRSTRGMVINQSRKLGNMVVNGNDPQSTTNRAVWLTQKGIRGGLHTAKAAYKHREIIKRVGSKFIHPVRSIRSIVSVISSLISSLLSLVASIPVVASIIAVLLPLLIVILCVFTVITTILGWVGIQPKYGNIETVATQEYAANAFIYEAKQRGWKSNAIQGVLAYMLAENLSEMGTFTYESFWVVRGPSDQFRDKTLDNDAWLEWLQGDGKVALRGTSYSNRSDIYCAIAIGLLADSDVWQTASRRSATNATKLINYCESKGQPWQDPRTQLTYYFEHVFTGATVFDTRGVDPTRDNRSAEEWCRRITAGYGMPAWSWTTNNQYMLKHVEKLDQAKRYLDNYRHFSYVSLTGGNLSAGPDFSNINAWKAPSNPYAPTFYGQCTWFAWGRFYEIYGYDPGFWGNGYQCVGQLLQAHPDKFEFSTTPKAGAVGSSDAAHNHVWIVLAVDGDRVTVQEGNLDGANNTWADAILDWHTTVYTMDGLRATYGNVTYANPK